MEKQEGIQESGKENFKALKMRLLTDVGVHQVDIKKATGEITPEEARVQSLASNEIQTIRNAAEQRRKNFSFPPNGDIFELA